MALDGKHLASHIGVRTTLPRSLKSTVSSVARLSGLTRLAALRYAGIGHIFFLHSIVDDIDDYLDLSLRCSARRLESIMTWLQDSKFEFVSLDQALQRIECGSCAPFAAFTFDDGYADNLHLALPVMERFSAPFTVYVSTGMITRELECWWLAIAELIKKSDVVEIPEVGLHLKCSDRNSKIAAFRFIERRVHEDFQLIGPLLRAAQAAAINLPSLLDREALTEPELKKLASHPLVEIGGHTSTHRNLALSPEPLVEWEMTTNKKFLEEQTGKEVVHFAYPFGEARACGLREAIIAKRVGFRSAVTTRGGALFPEHRKHMLGLPRHHLSYDETRSSLRCKTDGFYQAIRSKGAPPILSI